MFLEKKSDIIKQHNEKFLNQLSNHRSEVLMKSLQTRMMVIFSLLFLLLSMLLSWQIYNSSTRLVIKTISLQAQTIAEHAVEKIDVNRFKEIDPETGPNDYYTELREQLNEIKETNSLKYLYTMNRREKENGYEYFYVVDGFPLESDEASELGDIEENYYENLVTAFDTKQAQLGELTNDEEYGATVTAYVPILDDKGEIAGVIGADFNADNIYQLMQTEKRKAILMSGLILLVGIVIIFILARYLVKPLKNLIMQIKKVQSGDFTVLLETKRQDEVGELTLAFNEMIQDLKEMIKGIYKGSEQLHQSAKSLSESSNLAVAAASDSNDKVYSLTDGSKRQVEIVQDAASTITEMSVGIEAIAKNLDEVASSSLIATKASEGGRQQIEQAVSQMKNIHVAQDESSRVIQDLDQNSKQIGQIVDTITDIANQTNLLALNAAIEAARAGEHGKGFAVVSEEVRKLAEESGKAAEQISKLIQEIQSKTAAAVTTIDHSSKEVKSGTTIIANSGEAFYEIIRSIQCISEQINSVTASTEELASGSSQIVTVIEEVKDIAKISANATEVFAGVINDQEALAQEITASTEKLNKMADELAELVKTFKV